MTLLWFLLGLLIGWGGLRWPHIKLKLQQLTRSLRPTRLQWPLSSPSHSRQAIVAQTQSHDALLKDLETWKHIFHSAPVGVLQVDEENQLIWCNLHACQLLSIQPPQLANRRLLLELVRSYELDQLIEQTRVQQQPCQNDWIFHPVSTDPSQLSRQSPRPLRGHGIPLADDFVGVFLESRQEAMALAQQRDRWISDVAHELKTPLTSIRLVAETLQVRLESPLRDWVDRLLKETIRLSSLVQDLLDLSQLEANPNPSLTLKPVDLTKLIQAAWFSLEPLARRKQLQLDYTGPDHLVLPLDESRMHRVLLNLLDNAIRYSPPQQPVRVQVGLVADSSTPSGQFVCLDVIDGGPGFLLDDLPYVFDRFYRGDPSRTRNRTSLEVFRTRPGTRPSVQPLDAHHERDYSAKDDQAVPASSGSGLGLAIVRQIVEAHQGTVKASNHPETHGGWLQVFLPWPLSDE